MKNADINLDVIRRVARALGEINDRVVYVGGAVVSLYANDPAADDVRPTRDVDISLEVASVGELEKLRENLVKKGFLQKTEDTVMCRFHYEDITVDVMSTKEVGWATSDKWFAPGFKHLEEKTVKGEYVRLFPLSYFLAAKFSAFHDRGSSDPRTSHDFEDITYVIDNRTDLAENILSSPDDVKEYLKSEFQSIMDNPHLQEAILGNLFYEIQTERFQLIMDKLKKIIDSI